VTGCQDSVPPRVAIVTRPVGHHERYNYLGRAAEVGERFFVCTRPTYGSVDTDHGIALTEQADGDFPFFEFPLDAVQVVDGDSQVLVKGAAGDSWHDGACLVSRYPSPVSDLDGFPWCTCAWRHPRTRG
jgi:hypothetical protein